MVASGSSSSPAPSPYYIHHRPAQSHSPPSTQPALDDHRNHHFDASGAGDQDDRPRCRHRCHRGEPGRAGQEEAGQALQVQARRVGPLAAVSALVLVPATLGRPGLARCSSSPPSGRFEILCLAGSYLVIDDGVSRTRNGGVCIALCGADHRVTGGSVGGVLTAAGTVQVIVGSIMYTGLKKKTKKGMAEQEAEAGTEEANGGGGGEEGEETPPPPLMMGGWWTGMMRQMESRSCNIDINLIRVM